MQTRRRNRSQAFGLAVRAMRRRVVDHGHRSFDAQSEILDVSFVSGGILAVGRRRAAVFDRVLGIWLPALRPAEDLEEGAGR